MLRFFGAAWTRSCVVAVAVFSCPFSLRAEEDASSEALLPPDTYLFVSCPSASDLKDRFKETAIGKMWNDRSMSGFRAEWAKHMEQADSQVLKEIGIPLGKLLTLPDGEVTLAVCKVKGKLGGVLIVDVGESTETAQKLLGMLDKKLEEQQGTKSTDTYQEVEITSYKKEGGAGGTVSHFTDDSYVVLSMSQGTELVKAVIDRWDGKHEKTFAKNETYQAIVGECEESDDAYGDLYYYVDPIALALEVLKANPSTAGQAGLASAFLPQLGLDKLKAIGGVLSLESKDFDTVSRTMVVVTPPVTGVLNIFKMPATIESPPKWVDKSIDQYSAFNWDVAGAYKAIGDIYTMFSQQPGGLDAMMDQVAGAPQNPGIHPKKDIFDQLTGMVHMLSKADETSLEDQAQKMLFAIGIKDDVKMQSLLEKVSAKAPNLKSRQFEGVTIYQIDNPATPEAAFSFGVTRKHLFLATHPSALEAAIRGKSAAEEPLSEDEDYKAVAEHFPDKASSIGFSRPASQMKAVWELARKGTFNENLHGLDLTKLPEFSAVEKFFAVSGSFIEPTDNGAVMVNFSLPVE